MVQTEQIGKNVLATMAASAALAGAMIAGAPASSPWKPTYVHPWGASGYCLSAPVMEEFQPVVAAACGKGSGEGWITSTQLWIVTVTDHEGNDIAVFASSASPKLCLGWSPKTRLSVVLVDCATEGHASVPLGIHDAGRGAYVITYLSKYTMTLPDMGAGKVVWTSRTNGNQHWAIPVLSRV